MSPIKSMMMAVAFAASSIATASIAAPVAEAQGTKIIVVDQNYVINEAQGLTDITTKVRNIGEQIDNELNPERSALESELASLQARVGSRTQEQVQADASFMAANQAFARKQAAFSEKEFIRTQELLETRNTAIQELTESMYVVIDTIMNEQGAQLVLDRTNAVSFAEAIDMTDTVLARLNQQAPTVNVNRKRFTAEERQERIAAASQQQRQQAAQLAQQGLRQQRALNALVAAQQQRQQGQGGQ